MIESILPTLSGGLLGGPSSPTVAPKKKEENDVPKTVTVKEPAKDKASEPQTPAAPAKMLECDYDLNPSELYQAIEAKQWDYAISLFKKDEKKTTDPNGDELVSGSVEEQACTWVVRKESNGKLRWRLLPLHAGIIFGAPVELVELMLQAYPQGAHHKDDQGMLPLHLAFRNEASWELMEELLTAHPQAIHVKDRKGRTPLQCGARSVSSAVSIASANNSLSSNKPLTPEQHQAMRDHMAFRNVVNIIELWAQIAVSGERQRGIQESRTALETRISQMQESHLSTLTTLKREWQTQQEDAAKQVQELQEEAAKRVHELQNNTSKQVEELKEANMTLQGQLQDAGHALQVARAHYQELQDELSEAKIELLQREEMLQVSEAEKYMAYTECAKKDAENYALAATAVPDDTYVIADELHASESMRHQQQLEFEQKKHELSLKQLEITSVAKRQIGAYQNTNRVLRRNITELVDQLESAHTRFTDLINRYQAIRDDRSQLVRNLQRQCVTQAEQEISTLENARKWLGDSKRRLQDQQFSLAEEKKVEDTLEFVERTSLDLSRQLEEIRGPPVTSATSSYRMPIDMTSYTASSLDEVMEIPSPTPAPSTAVAPTPEMAMSRPAPEVAMIRSSVTKEPERVAPSPPLPELDPVDEEPIMVQSEEEEEEEDLDAKFAAAMDTGMMASGVISNNGSFIDTVDSSADPAAPASSPVYQRYTRKYSSDMKPPAKTYPKLDKTMSNGDDMAMAPPPMSLPIVNAYNVASPPTSPRVIDLSNVASPKSIVSS